MSHSKGSLCHLPSLLSQNFLIVILDHIDRVETLELLYSSSQVPSKQQVHKEMAHGSCHHLLAEFLCNTDACKSETYGVAPSKTHPADCSSGQCQINFSL